MNYSYSTLAQFQKCRYLFHLLHVRDIHAAPKPSRMELGSMVHIGLAALLRGQGTSPVIEVQNHVDRYFPLLPNTADDLSYNPNGDRAEMLAMADIALSIVFGAQSFLNGKWKTAEYLGLPLVEAEFDVPVSTQRFDHDLYAKTRRFVYRVDWVAQEVETGSFWLFDHKTRTALQPDELEDYNLQMAIYQCLLERMGIHTVGSVTFQIRSSVPSAPRLNLNGEMSRADIACDWGTYKKHLLLAGLNPDDYEDMQRKLSGKEFFRLTRTYRSSEYLQAIWEDVIEPNLEEMEDFLESYPANAVAPRNMHSVNCKLCAQREFCHNELRGYDVESLIDSGVFVKEAN